MYKALIGLEMHCEISNTNTKVFSDARNEYSNEPNTNVVAIDMGFPGVLPILNKEAIKMAIMTSVILGCKLPEYIQFERKNYYYPDLPKGYQITQETKPIPVGIYGSLEYICESETKTAYINNVHLEEDAASTTHYSNYSTINYNRAGVPLLELVTEPCFHSAKEAVAFLETMRSIYQFAGISEADSKKGQVRCDVNISIMDANLDEKDQKNWGTKIEIKNVNSFNAVKNTINYEIDRQFKLKANGEYNEMQQETRRWSEEKQETIFMRNKADAIDYKYFIEPNIPKYKITNEFVESIKKDIPKLAFERKKQYMNDYKLSEYDAKILVKSKKLSDYFEKTITYNVEPKMAANFINTNILGHLNKNNLNIEDIFLRPKMLADLITLVSNRKISSNQAKEVLTESLLSIISPIEIIDKKGIKQNTNENEIINFINEVINENSDAVNSYKNGKANMIDYLVGQVMKKSRGQVDPSITKSKMIEILQNVN